MKVNPHKSTFISGVIGKVGRQWLRNRQSRGGIGRTLDFGTPGQPLLVPQSTTLKYLGVIVSYQRFEDQTLASRLQSASVTRHRLLKVLHASRFLPVQKRLQLYMACVRSTALYSIPVIGIKPKGVRQLQAFGPNTCGPLRDLLFISPKNHSVSFSASGASSSYGPHVQDVREGIDCTGGYMAAGGARTVADP